MKFLKKIKDALKKVYTSLARKFDISLSLGRKKDPEHPLVRVNVKGEIPKAVVKFCAIVGAITIVFTVIKIIRKFK